eukprot:scaffold3239_cov67-Phaeocystis_antarctica.AAC.4
MARASPLPMMRTAAALRLKLRALHRLLRGRNGRAGGEHLLDGGLARVHLPGLVTWHKPAALAAAAHVADAAHGHALRRILDKGAPAREGRRALRHAGERPNHRAVVVVGQLTRGGVGHHDLLVRCPLVALRLRAGEAVGHHEDHLSRRHEGVRHQQLHLAPGAPRVLGRPRGDDAGARSGESRQRRHVRTGRVLVGARPVDPPEDLEVGVDGYFAGSA